MKKCPNCKYYFMRYYDPAPHSVPGSPVCCRDPMSMGIEDYRPACQYFEKNDEESDGKH